MNSNFHNVFQVAAVAAALVMSSSGWADEGLTGKLTNRTREQRSEQRADSGTQRSAPNREGSRPARAEQPARSAPQRSGPAREAPSVRREQPRPSVQRETPAAAPSAPAPAAAREERSGIERLIGRQLQSRDEAPRQERPTPGAAQAAPANNGQSSNRGADRGITGGLVQREYQTNNGRNNDRNSDRGNDRNNDRGNDRPRDSNGNNNGNWDRDDRRNAWNDRDRRDRERQWHRDNRPGRVIQRLPAGYRDYSWGSRRYYYSGGSWYQPYGGTYISVGIPYGMFITTLPGAYSSFWFGSTRYFYSDYNYYTYDPGRRGYVIVESPYSGDGEGEGSSRGDDLFIYPAKGQSEQQQADDRYECHRWGVEETDYDPIDDEYDADLREDYLRAMTACLTGRGYTVR